MIGHRQTHTDTLSDPAGASWRAPGLEVLEGSTRLGPDQAFPADLGSLTLVELQVLHSRVSLQLEDEYLEASAGPHPVTLDRHQELLDALDAHHYTDALSDPAGASWCAPGLDVLEGSARLGPGEMFPADLGSLTLVELQILHSRVSLQLEDEYLEAPAGPHPVTWDRHQELLDALDVHRHAREGEGW